MINLFFDVDDTLYDQLQPFKRALEEVFWYTCDMPCEELFRRSRYYSDAVFEDVQAGRMSKGEMYIYRIARAFEDCGIRLEHKKAMEFQNLYAQYQTEIELIPEFRRVLEWCKRHGNVMGIITNGPAQHQKNKIEKLGLKQWIDKDYIFISEEMKLSKPDVRLFRLVQERFDLNPQATYYIGDSFFNDVVGAKNAGWNVIWVNRRQRELPGEPHVLPDYTISEYSEIWHVIQKII
ncbi:MAG: HAD family hydrolase [Clostridium sp.]|nr:HAD family hydrolase [Clostridium sp.]